MNLETPGQRITVLALSLAFVGLLAVCAAWVLVSIGEENARDFAEWVDSHLTTITAFFAGTLPAIATYLFGRRAGRKVGKTEAFNSAIATAEEKSSGDAAASALRSEAKSHGIRVVT